ncbi:hypothetical protein E2C01_008463 [Portunus trituberculatus]|uniref:Uncharacterized protein n=1 Tax=Portunus trituberculatus TaxID=210409 RepID=A0A5B7D2X6_PORTR|nr:hypothetical protein [Portunus trituberculatus]
MSPFRTCYFRTFENFSALRTSTPRLVVRRYGGAEVRTELRKCPALVKNNYWTPLLELGRNRFRFNGST